VVATRPAEGAVAVAPTTELTIELSRPLATSVPPPTLSPPVSGHWTSCGSTQLCFTPTAPFPSGTGIAVTVPLTVRRTVTRKRGNHRPVVTTRVASSFVLHFETATESLGLAQVLLAQLGYLPLELPSMPVPVDTAASTAAASAPASTDPATALTWRYSDVPAALTASWAPGQDTTITQGALVQFERVHDLTDGSYPPYATSLTPPVWQALVAASLADAHDPDPYAVAEVSETLPERLTVWSDGADILTTLVNTGIPGGATPTGTYFVYLRYVSQTMRGTTVTGAPYVYPNVPDVNYFSGNFAIHGFARARYGFPQSQGCVELPLTEAPVVYGDLHYGSIVSIT
jgi:lipoprotein-anchoring transpeptidase ErfK/SrfK